jgi:hypothetical protein
MEHLAGPDTRTHPGVAATDRSADANSSAPGDPAALIDTNAHTDRTHACADTQVHAAAADTHAQRHTGKMGTPMPTPAPTEAQAERYAEATQTTTSRIGKQVRGDLIMRLV